jgi:hypothetical protein
MCRVAMPHSFTIIVRAAAQTVLLADDGAELVVGAGEDTITKGNITPFDRHTCAARLCQLGANHATLFRIGTTSPEPLYRMTGLVTPEFVDLFFRVPEASLETREGRALKRELRKINSLVMFGGGMSGLMPPYEFATAHVFPIQLSDISDTDEEDDNFEMVASSEEDSDGEIADESELDEGAADGASDSGDSMQHFIDDEDADVSNCGSTSYCGSVSDQDV